MRHGAAKKLITDTFTQEFSKDRFAYFSKNLLNTIDTSKAFHARGYVKDKFKKTVNVIKTYERLGTYTDPEDNTIDILIVYLQKDESLDRARTTQRNFVADYLKDRNRKNAALVAYVTPTQDDWRFSLVKMEYDIEAGKIKTEFSPARRWSFLVGRNENTHTARKQLLPILENEKAITLSDLEEAFSIETVTKEFFQKYRELFHDVQESLEKIVEENVKVKADFEEKNVDTVDLAKKLLGQIVFLYFLQRKGWFGVKRDEEWGEGPKDFLRRLFEKTITGYDNFFNQILEPLFYEALARPRTDDYYSRFDCKIPFLNGGLFDALNDYDWVHTDINLPNKLFSNEQKTEEGDTGTGILDVFDRYNFTVKEDEPLEKEVAVDPEMLGRVFENLLEVKDRKSKGTYYTPREIVHYMCQESLVNYLATQLKEKVEEDELRLLIEIGESSVEHDQTHVEKTENNKNYDGDYADSRLPDTVVKNAMLIDQKLAEIKVCDPAVGSGAFPVGMMNEIVRTRNALSPHIQDGERSIYGFKRHAIKNSLYGVDIDPGAVEIAKLRLWLSLIVDEEDRQDIQPLPNLDYKIMQGNSLLEEYERVKLDIDGDKETEQIQIDSTKTEAQKLTDKLQELRKQFFKAMHKTEKDRLKNQIEELTWQLIEESLKEKGKEDKLQEIEQFKKSNTKPFFLWHLNFSEVFEKKAGFDIIIANPPYVRADSDEDYLEFRKTLEKTGRFKTLYEKWDLYIPFIELAFQITNEVGVLSFIISNAICTSKYAQKLLDLIQEEYAVNSIDYFEGFDVFEAGVVPVVFLFSKAVNLGSHVNKILRQNEFVNPEVLQTIPLGDFKKQGRNAFRKDYYAMPVRINTVQLGNICYMSKGMVLNSDEKINKGAFTKNDLISKNQTKVHTKKYIEGKNLQNYHIEKIRYLEWDTERVPNRLSRATFPELYVLPKIMIGRVTGGIFDEIGLLSNDSIVIMARYCDLKGTFNLSIKISITKFTNYSRQDLERISQKFNLKYILAILNSRFANFYLNNIRRHRLKNYFYPSDYRKLPIATIGLEEQEEFVDLVDKIRSFTRKEDYMSNESAKEKVGKLKTQINQLVYELYDLTPEEIEIVEGGT